MSWGLLRTVGVVMLASVAVGEFDGTLWNIMEKNYSFIVIESLCINSGCEDEGKNLCHEGIHSWEYRSLHNDNIQKRRKTAKTFLVLLCWYWKVLLRTSRNQQKQTPQLSAAFTSLVKGSLPLLICLWSECPDSFPMRLLLLFCPLKH